MSPIALNFMGFIKARQQIEPKYPLTCIIIPVQFPLSSFCVLLTQKQSYEPWVFVQMADGGQL